MLPIMSGTIYSMGKMAELESKWKQKKESGKIFQKEMTAEERLMARYQEDLENMRKNDTMNSISGKLRSGQELTPEEVRYLQKNNPALYQEYQEIRSEKEAYERGLKNCKTKEDVERFKINKMNGYLSQAKSVMNNPNIPKGQKKALMEKILGKTMGIEKVHMKFVASGGYAALPTDEELAEEKKRKNAQAGESAEAVSDSIREDAEIAGEDESTGLTDRGQEDAPEGENAGEKVIITDRSLTELGERADALADSVKAQVSDYLVRERDPGYGLEFFGYDQKGKAVTKK
ncbi:MAG: hypothetical protein K2P71_13950 [Lachnospiraceae bacterium]|nr:hypothetical protein [Lachnospiraceae bacterium]